MSRKTQEAACPVDLSAFVTQSGEVPLLASEHPSPSHPSGVTGDDPAALAAYVLDHVERAVDVLDAVLRAPGGPFPDDALETALDHLYLAASALRHRPGPVRQPGPPESAPPAPGLS